MPVYKLQWSAEEMRAYAIDQAAAAKQRRLNQIIGEIEAQIRRAAHKGEMRLKLKRELFWDEAAHVQSQINPDFEGEYYQQEDYASYFTAGAGYRIIHSGGDTYLSWEPKPELMDD